MRFFHLSDLHIGIKLHNYDLQADQKDILEQIIHAAEEPRPDAVVIAGDIYDRAIPGPATRPGYLLPAAQSSPQSGQ